MCSANASQIALSNPAHIPRYQLRPNGLDSNSSTLNPTGQNNVAILYSQSPSAANKLDTYHQNHHLSHPQLCSSHYNSSSPSNIQQLLFTSNQVNPTTFGIGNSIINLASTQSNLSSQSPTSSSNQMSSNLAEIQYLNNSNSASSNQMSAWQSGTSNGAQLNAANNEQMYTTVALSSRLNPTTYLVESRPPPTYHTLPDRNEIPTLALNNHNSMENSLSSEMMVNNPSSNSKISSLKQTAKSSNTNSSTSNNSVNESASNNRNSWSPRSFSQENPVNVPENMQLGNNG